MGEPRLLVVVHSRSGRSAELAAEVRSGAGDPEIEGVGVDLRAPTEVDVDEVEEASGLILVSPERFGSMAGLVKDMLERIYHPCLEAGIRRPHAFVIAAGNDGSGALESMRRIMVGLKWPEVLPPVLSVEPTSEAHRASARETGATFAAGLSLGMY